MPIVTCPQCRNPLDIPNELLGGPVRCADCMNVFTPNAVSPQPVVTVARPKPTSPVLGEEGNQPEFVEPPRTKAWLWVLLIGCTFMSFACCGSCAGLYGFVVKPAMLPYADPDNQFTASFPGKPREMSLDRKDTTGIECVRDIPAEEHYFIEYTKLTPAQQKEDPIKVANDALDAWIKNLGEGRFRMRSKVDFKGLPAMKDFGQLDLFVGRLKGFVALRAVKDGDRVYILGEAGSVTESDRRVNQFFDDFTPKGAKIKNDHEQNPDNDNGKPPPEEGSKKKKNPFKGN